MTRLRKDGTPWGRKWREWTAEEEALLRELAGTMSLADLAAKLSAFAGYPRTAEAVRIRAVRRGISLWRQGWSLRDVEALFRVDHRTIVAWWITPGLLTGERWAGRGPYESWLFTEAALRQFIVESGYAYNWRRMQPRHPLTALAEVTARRDPWVPYAEAARYVGIASSNLDRWRRRGLVPTQRRFGTGKHGELFVRASDLPDIRERIHAAQARARFVAHAKFTARRRGEAYQEQAA